MVGAQYQDQRVAGDEEIIIWTSTAGSYAIQAMHRFAGSWLLEYLNSTPFEGLIKVLFAEFLSPGMTHKL